MRNVKSAFVFSGLVLLVSAQGCMRGGTYNMPMPESVILGPGGSDNAGQAAGRIPGTQPSTATPVHASSPLLAQRAGR